MLYFRGFLYIVGAAFAFAMGLRLVFCGHRLGAVLGGSMFVWAINCGLQASYVIHRAETGAYPPWLDVASWFNALFLMIAPVVIYLVFERLTRESKE